MESTKISNLGLIEDKTYSFALRIIKAHKYLTDKNIYVLSKQLLRSGLLLGLTAEKLCMPKVKWTLLVS